MSETPQHRDAEKNISPEEETYMEELRQNPPKSYSEAMDTFGKCPLFWEEAENLLLEIAIDLAKTPRQSLQVFMETPDDTIQAKSLERTLHLLRENPPTNFAEVLDMIRLSDLTDNEELKAELAELGINLADTPEEAQSFEHFKAKYLVKHKESEEERDARETREAFDRIYSM